MGKTQKNQNKPEVFSYLGVNAGPLLKIEVAQ